MSINSCRATATAAFFLSTYYCHSVLYATAPMPRNICLAFTCFWSLFLLTDSVSADWLFILSRLLAIQQPGNTHGIYLNPPSHDHLSFAICYLSFRRSRFPCPRYSSCIRRLSRRSAMGPEATISPCCSKYPLSATANARPAFCSTRRTPPGQKEKKKTKTEAPT